MNSSTAILLQMNSTATLLLSLPPCPCNTALHCRHAAALLTTLLNQCGQPAHTENTALEMPSSHHTAAVQLLLMLPDARTKKNGDVAMPNNSLTFNYVITSPGQSSKAIKWPAEQSNGYYGIIVA
jgi:hypothetical protein